MHRVAKEINRLKKEEQGYGLKYKEGSVESSFYEGFFHALELLEDFIHHERSKETA